MTTNTDVAIVIVNFNTGDLLERCLQSVFEKTDGIAFHVIVVDNGSTDDSLSKAKSRYGDTVRFIESGYNLGFGGGNNLALRGISTRYVFLLNPDTELINNAVKILYDFMEREGNEDVACCGGSLNNANREPTEISYGNFPSIKQIAFEHFGLSRLFRKYHRRHVSVNGVNYDDTVKEVPYITGADMFIRSIVLDRVGRFDEDFFLYYEDVELSYRFHRSGYRSMLVPAARIIHHCGASSREVENVNKTIRARKSELLFHEKCYGMRSRMLAKALLIYGYFVKYIFTFNRSYLVLLKEVYRMKVLS